MKGICVCIFTYIHKHIFIGYGLLCLLQFLCDVYEMNVYIYIFFFLFFLCFACFFVFTYILFLFLHIIFLAVHM